MAKHTKAISGPAKRKYFRDALRADPGVSPEAAKRLTEKFDAELSHMRARNHPALNAGAAAQPAADNDATAPAKPATAPPALAEPAFDPHAFSLIVVMTRQGPDGLKARLEAIDNAEHLRALARAQHVAIDTALDQPAALRTAIIAGTAQRIADRRAAAS
jgi:hypothetical protein